MISGRKMQMEEEGYWKDTGKKQKNHTSHITIKHHTVANLGVQAQAIVFVTGHKYAAQDRACIK